MWGCLSHRRQEDGITNRSVNLCCLCFADKLRLFVEAVAPHLQYDLFEIPPVGCRRYRWKDIDRQLPTVSRDKARAINRLIRLRFSPILGLSASAATVQYIPGCGVYYRLRISLVQTHTHIHLAVQDFVLASFASRFMCDTQGRHFSIQNFMI